MLEITLCLLLWILQDIFCLIVGTFSGLSETNGPSFGRRVIILETLARYRSCVVMLDLECDDLISELFRTFFSVARYVWFGDRLKQFPSLYIFDLRSNFLLVFVLSCWPYVEKNCIEVYHLSLLG